MKVEKTYTHTFMLEYNPADLSTAQEKGVRIIKSKSGKMFPTFYKKAKVAKNEKELTELLLQHKPKTPIANDGDTCVDLDIVYMFPHRSGTPKSKLDLTTFMTQRPDADNISKTVVDCMTKCGFWEDDSMVNFRFRKFRCAHPHILFKIDIYRQVWDE